MSWERFAAADEALGVRRTLVLLVTLWLTYRSFVWAADYAMAMLAAKVDAATLTGSGAVILAVTAPVTYLQKVVLESYIAAKAVAMGGESMTTTTTIKSSDPKP